MERRGGCKKGAVAEDAERANIVEAMEWRSWMLVERAYVDKIRAHYLAGRNQELGWSRQDRDRHVPYSSCQSREAPVANYQKGDEPRNHNLEGCTS
jgi:hypothetical protein